jgi:diguanylate cyclase (GGDEF)-like protein
MFVLKEWRKHLPSLAILGCCALGVVVSCFVANIQVHSAWQAELASREAEVTRQADNFRFKLDLIGSNLRTISLLPGVREIDRHAENLEANSKSAIQQIYNNLATQIEISEVYILPADFNPGRLDPKTGKLEEPIIMFDELIIEAGRYANAPNPHEAAATASDSQPEIPEVEDLEYAELAKQAAVMRTQWGKFDRNLVKRLPVYVSAEVLTCDNTEFVATRRDKDRAGVMFSAPFYRTDGELGGMVTAIVRSNTIRAMVPSSSFQVFSPTHAFSDASNVSHSSERNWQPSVFRTGADLVFDIGSLVKTTDPQGPWQIKMHHTAKSFYDSKEFDLIRKSFWGSVLTLIVLSGLGQLWVGSLRRHNMLLKHRSLHDSLTNLPNRRLLAESIDGAIKSTARGQSAFLLYLDLDRFKIVNDTMGHLCGDAVIVEAATRIKQAVRDIDIVARVGGDEFVVLLNNIEGRVGKVNQLIERIISHVNQPMMVHGRSVEVGVSIGATSIHSQDLSSEDILRNADLALFRAKAEERGAYRFYDQQMDEDRLQHQRKAGFLREALANQEFKIHYQLIVAADSGKPVGCEALLRWHHHSLGAVSPLDFIPLAEELGLIGKIGEWVLRQACLDAMKLPSHFHMSVNVSPLQMLSRTLALQVVSALHASGLPASRLQLECTESVFLSPTPDVLEVFKQLRQLGVSIALDDFGVGFSSLGYLKEFEFDRIKLDRSFLKSVGSTRERVVLKAVAGLGIALGVPVTAEGVETQEQLAVVREHGCSEVQGYLFSKPQKLEDVLAELSGREALRAG